MLKMPIVTCNAAKENRQHFAVEEKNTVRVKVTSKFDMMEVTATNAYHAMGSDGCI